MSDGGKGSSPRPFAVDHQTFASNWDLAFSRNKGEDMQVRVATEDNTFGKCGCGRSPTGKCIGWHGLSDEQLAEAKRNWDLEQYTKQAQELWNDSCTSPRK
jgi:hypothetical protein